MSPARKDPDLETYRGRCAARLKQLREKAGLTVEQAAESLIASGVIANQRSLYKWESAASLPKIADLPTVAELYNLKSPRSLLPEK